MLALTPREITCLKWAAAGKTSIETGMILQISNRTVDYHIQNACNKLGVSNRQAAIATAVRMGMLPNLHKLLPKIP